MTEGSFRDWPLPASPPTEPPPVPPGMGGPSGRPSPSAAASSSPGGGKGTRSFAGKRSAALVGGVAALALVAGSLGAAIGVSLASKNGTTRPPSRRHRPLGGCDHDPDPDRPRVHDAPDLGLVVRRSPVPPST